MTIILALCIPVTSLVTGFFVLKAVQLGLRWQIQTKQEQQPTMEIKNPITPVLHQRQEKEQTNILAEWLNGAPEEGR